MQVPNRHTQAANETAFTVVQEHKVGSFEMQPATNDVTGLTRYSPNTAIYINAHVLLISLY